VLAQGIGTAGYEMKYGDEYMAARQYDLAAMRFRQAVQLDPENAEAQFRLAQAYLKLGRTQEASAALNRAYALDPSLKARAGELPTPVGAAPAPAAAPAPGPAPAPATAAAWTGLDVGNTPPPPIGTSARETYYGKQYLAQGDYDLAAQRLRQAVGLDAGDAEAQFWLAGAYRGLGDTARAQQALAKAEQLDPSLKAREAELARFKPKPKPATPAPAPAPARQSTASNSCDDLYATCYASATRCSFYNPNPNSSGVYTGCTPDFGRQSTCMAERNACYARNGKR
jgi:tetratricopeptide (TPR) repeat protein